MYCGKNKTALASQQQIAKTLLLLLSEKAYQDISVSELCREAGVSRQTFYSLFSSKDDVMTFVLQERCCWQPDPDPAHSCLEQMCVNYSRYLAQQRTFIRALVDNRIIYLLNDSLMEVLGSCACLFEDLPAQSRRYAACFLAGGFTSIAQNYVLEEPPLSEAALSRLCIDLFKGNLLL